METIEKKTKRSVVKRAKIAAVKAAAKSGPSTAYLKNVPSSPRKMRLVADIIRGERVSKALSILKYEAQHAAAKLEKLLLSAISAWEAKNTDVKLEEADLYVKEIFVDGGRQLKRLRPAPQGSRALDRGVHAGDPGCDAMAGTRLRRRAVLPDAAARPL